MRKKKRQTVEVCKETLRKAKKALQSSHVSQISELTVRPPKEASLSALLSNFMQRRKLICKTQKRKPLPRLSSSSFMPRRATMLAL